MKEQELKEYIAGWNMGNESMRNAFWNKIYDIAIKDKDVVMINADMGAPALDKFRKDLPNQYFNVGIAEHNMIAIATGLAKEGKKVFTYAIAPFITSRCYEFTKISAGIMKIPIKLIGVGAGFGYEDSGPTHHTTEDISIMRVIPNLEIYCPSDINTACSIAEMMYNSKNPGYVRLERKIMPELYKKDKLFNKGFEELVKGKDIAIVSTGNMVHRALEIHEELEKKGKSIGIIDLYKLKPIDGGFDKTISKYKKIISLEEHLLDGGLGSIIAERILDNDLPIKLKRIGLGGKYYYLYGRDYIHEQTGLDAQSIVNEIKKLSK